MDSSSPAWGRPLSHDEVELAAHSLSFSGGEGQPALRSAFRTSEALLAKEVDEGGGEEAFFCFRFHLQSSKYRIRLSHQGKILVIRGGAIGDFILTLPAIAALREQFPDAHVEVLGYPHIIQLAVAGGLVDQVQSIEARALAGFFARGGILSQDLADYFSEFDLIISYLYDPDNIFQTNVGLCGRAQFIAGPHRPDESSSLPAARVFLKPLERLAIFEADPIPRLRMRRRTASSKTARCANGADKDSDWPQSAAEPVLALHPGSGAENKNWPESAWTEFMRTLVSSTTLRLLLVGGEAEGQRLDRLAALVPQSRLEMALHLPLPDLAAILERCSAFVGHDSGISHLAAAIGLGGLVLWGETNEQIWRPPSEKVNVIRKNGGLDQLAASEVYEALFNLSCWSAIEERQSHK